MFVPIQLQKQIEEHGRPFWGPRAGRRRVRAGQAEECRGRKKRQRAQVLKRSDGVTLVEIMAGLVVFGILIAASLPAFRNYMSTQLVEGTVNRFAVNLRLARQKAATEGNNYMFTFDPATSTYRILDDNNNNSVLDAGEIVHGPFTIPAELTVTNGPAVPFPGDTLLFFPNGTASNTGEVTISNTRGFSRVLSVVRSTGAVAIR
ncbi:MAG: GspH/FimT family pseudopilin [Candidatus Eiseniibacteriota bacterium]|nr:MAG: GspH/FimT family pseudopilin [Candidatus Eisenbacteria bacterium]